MAARSEKITFPGSQGAPQTSKSCRSERVQVLVRHDKRHSEDCQSCAEGKAPKIDHFERIVRLAGDLDETERRKLLAIADKCPVHNTLEKGSRIVTAEER